jgi:hypothetical protein
VGNTGRGKKGLSNVFGDTVSSKVCITTKYSFGVILVQFCPCLCSLEIFSNLILQELQEAIV